MKLLDLPQAKRFCAPATAIVEATGRQSLPAFHSALSGVNVLKEGTSNYNAHQVNLLASVDRWLVYAVVHYRRSVEMLVPVSAPWAQVTLYYSSFFAANAILGMFGGWIGQTQTGNTVVGIEEGAGGTFELHVDRRAKPPNGARGSHRAFWDFFYAGAATIVAWAPPKLATALSPVKGDFAWQIAERNKVNYDMFHAWQASVQFFGSFKPAKLRSLTGPLQLQLEGAERIVTLALYFANAVKLATDSLEGCGAKGSRLQIKRRLATQVAAKLLGQSGFGALLEL